MHTYVDSSRGRGRGVFAGRRFKEHDLIEICPVLLFNVPEGQEHLLEGFAFRWSKKKIALALGNGSLYNHSYQPNAYFELSFAEKTLDVYAYRNIDAGEEILFNYHGNPDCQDALWFKTK